MLINNLFQKQQKKKYFTLDTSFVLTSYDAWTLQDGRRTRVQRASDAAATRWCRV